MSIESFDQLIGTWRPAGSGQNGSDGGGGEREMFHFSPLGHFVIEWTDGARPHVQICDLELTGEGFAYHNPDDGSVLELEAWMDGSSLVLVPPHGHRTVLRRVVEEMEAQDFEFFVKG